MVIKEKFIVYVLEYEIPYEGSSFMGVFSSIEKAKEYSDVTNWYPVEGIPNFLISIKTKNHWKEAHHCISMYEVDKPE